MSGPFIKSLDPDVKAVGVTLVNFDYKNKKFQFCTMGSYRDPIELKNIHNILENNFYILDIGVLFSEYGDSRKLIFKSEEGYFSLCNFSLWSDIELLTPVPDLLDSGSFTLAQALKACFI